MNGVSEVRDWSQDDIEFKLELESWDVRDGVRCLAIFWEYIVFIWAYRTRGSIPVPSGPFDIFMRVELISAARTVGFVGLSREFSVVPSGEVEVEVETEAEADDSWP